MILFYYFVILATALVQLAAVGFFLWKSYITCGADEVIVKTGFGGRQVVWQGGVIVLPLIQRYQRVSLAVVPLQVEFESSRPLRFSDGQQESLTVTAWVAPVTGPESDPIIDAVETLGARRLCDPDHLQRYYGDALRQSIQRAAGKAKRDRWFRELPEIPRPLYEAIEEVLEDFHRVHRITIASGQ